MSAATATHYAFDRTRTDHERLVRQARRQDPFAREACARAGLGPGDRAIDVGCGPRGALPVLAGAVGPDGTVVGLDASAASLARARRELDGLGLSRVQLVRADLTAVEPADVTPHGPFDLAFCRLVLMYQRDPAAALRRIAALLRPGGRLVVVDHLRDTNYPLFDPPVPGIKRLWAWFLAAGERRGDRGDSVALHHAELCVQAGLRVRERRGWLAIHDGPSQLAHYRDILLSMRHSLLTLEVATEAQIAALAAGLAAAMPAARLGTGTINIETIAEVPA
jgi:SAM-dependent methyltransferase